MKAAIISLGSVSSQWTAEAMAKYFDEVDRINLKEVEVRLGHEGGVLHKGNPIKDYDCVYVKGSFRYINLLRAISSLLNCYQPVRPEAFTSVHNKLLTHLELQRKGIPMPRTYISPSLEQAKELLKQVHYPIVMKFPEGTQGKGVMFADSESSASSLLDALGVLKQPFIIQEYIESGNMDIRIIVTGDKVAASMIRVAKNGENRANIHSGGEGKPYTPDRAERKIAVDAAKALGAEICGVDIIKGSKGPLVIEANISPGLQGITAVSGLDVADKLAKFLFERTHEFKGVKQKEEAKKIVSEKLAGEIITNLSFKGERVVLPEMVTKMAKLKENSEYSIKTDKGKVVIEEFKVG